MMDDPGIWEKLSNFLMGRGELKKAAAPQAKVPIVTPKQDTTQLQKDIQRYMQNREAEKKKPGTLTHKAKKALSGGI